MRRKSFLFLPAFLFFTLDAVATEWELIHQADIVVEETKQVIGTNRVELDTNSILRKGNRVSYRTREQARSYSIEREFILERESDCSGNRFRKLRVSDPKTQRTAPARIRDWQQPDFPFEEKLQRRVCAQ